jgi:membrane-associated protein
MELLMWFVDNFILHLDRNLVQLVADYQVWTYAILFVVIFCETGLVVTPFLPGDSLLFAAGAVSAAAAGHGAENPLNPVDLFLLLSVAAVLGDTVNYWAGRNLGLRVFERFIKREHLMKTHAFYERHGGKTIIIARFVPIVRTLAPFVAGVGEMTYGKFIAYNVVGGVAWPLLFVFAGYFFADTPLVKKNFTLVIFAIIILSILPGVIEILRAKLAKRKLAKRELA